MPHREAALLAARQSVVDVHHNMRLGTRPAPAWAAKDTMGALGQGYLAREGVEGDLPYDQAITLTG
jgi:hypothetical protein